MGTRDKIPGSSMVVAVLVPCLDEETTVAGVVTGFRGELSEATVYVYDNTSVDATAKRAAEAGAVVRFESIPGKGSVVRRMFADVDADVYVMADGDGTYDPADAPLLVKRLVEDNLDMVSAAGPDLQAVWGTLLGTGHSTTSTDGCLAPGSTIFFLVTGCLAAGTSRVSPRCPPGLRSRPRCQYMLRNFGFP